MGGREEGMKGGGQRRKCKEIEKRKRVMEGGMGWGWGWDGDGDGDGCLMG